MRPVLIATLFALTACAPPVKSLPGLDAGPVRPAPIAAPADGCGAAGLQVLVGQDVALFQSQARSGPSRILPPGTRPGSRRDADPARTTVTVDAQNRITGITCS